MQRTEQIQCFRVFFSSDWWSDMWKLQEREKEVEKQRGCDSSSLYKSKTEAKKRDHHRRLILATAAAVAVAVAAVGAAAGGASHE